MSAHSPSLDRQNHAQAAQIHAMATRRVPEADIAAASGCTIARVRQVLTQPAPDPTDHDDDDQRSRAAVRVDMRGLTVSKLLAATLEHPDQRVARLAAHIRSDIGALRALYAEARAREEHAAHLTQIEARMAAEHAQITATHRRHTDGQTA